MSEKGRTAAFFDFDETLLAIDSSSIGFKVLKAGGYLTRWFMVKMAGIFLLRKLGLVDEEGLARVFLGFYKGRQLQPFIDSADNFYSEYLQPNLAPKVLEKLRWHQAQGHPTILISGSIDYYLKPVQSDLKLDHLLCSHLEIDTRGLLTGRSKGPICVGEKKVVLALSLAQKEDLDLASSYAYGNSYLDIPILEQVGHPVAVNPDLRLARVAASRNWEILE